jgi:hypothetical protein
MESQAEVISSAPAQPRADTPSPEKKAYQIKYTELTKKDKPKKAAKRKLYDDLKDLSCEQLRDKFKQENFKTQGLCISRMAKEALIVNYLHLKSRKEKKQKTQ